MVDDVSHEGLRVLLHQEGVPFQRPKTWQQSRDPDFEAKKHRILYLYGLMDGTSDVQPGDPEVVICIDEFGPSTCNPTPAGTGPPAPAVGRDLTAGGATSTRPHGVRHLLAADDLARDRLYGHVKPRKRRGSFVAAGRAIEPRWRPPSRWALP